MEKLSRLAAVVLMLICSGAWAEVAGAWDVTFIADDGESQAVT